MAKFCNASWQIPISLCRGSGNTGKSKDPRSVLGRLFHPMSSRGLLTRFPFPENIYVICFFLKDLPLVNKAYVLGINEWNSTNIFLLKNWYPYQVYPIFQHNEGHNFIFVVLITSLFQIWEDQISKRLGFIMKLLCSLENVETSMQWGYFWWTWVKNKWRKWTRKLWPLWE